MKSSMNVNGIDILIAEDSRTQAEQLGFLLEQHGYRVTVAANGRLALQAAQTNKPTLLISDIVMPEMDGYELCKEIKSDGNLKDIMVILVTTLTDSLDVIRGLECGADNFIRKPYEEDYLLSRVEYLLMNLKMRKENKVQIGVEINLAGQKFFINSERQQILDLLISTYEQAIQVNNELDSLNNNLEEKVSSRTAALQESEALLQESQVIARLGSYILDIPGGTWKNSAMLDQLFGIDETYERSMEGWWALLHPDDCSMIMDYFKNEVLELGKDFDMEYRILRHDNKAKRWMHGIGKIELDPQGRPLEMHGTIQDITEHKQSEESLKQSHERFSTIFNQSPLGIAVIDSHTGEILEANPRFAEIAGRTPEEITTIDWMSITHPDDVQENLDNMALLNAGKIPGFNIDKRYMHPDGSLVWVNMKVAALRMSKNVSLRHLCMIDDITERRRLALDAQQKADQVLQLFESNADGLLVIARDGQICAANPAAAQLFDRPVEVLLGLPFGNPMAAGETAKSTIQPRTGSAKDVEMRSAEIIWDNQPASLTSLRDITETTQAIDLNRQQLVQLVFQNEEKEKRAAELAIANKELVFQNEEKEKRAAELAIANKELVFQNEEKEKREAAILHLNEELENKVAARTADLEKARLGAEQANRAKSVFLATMSHEIRTPMNGVIGMVDVLQQSSLKGYQVEMVDLIRESAYSLLGIINDILDFSKAEAGKIEIESAPMAVDNTVNKVCGILVNLAKKQNVEFTLFTDPAIPEAVMGDPLRLRQVLINLLSNAIKFTGGQERLGHVSVRAELAELGQEQAIVEFRIADNGLGMDNETLSRLFTPFTQADSRTTRRFGGTGLGLAISRQLVELMGGEITVQSELGKGALFTARLPFALVPQKLPSVAVPSMVAGLSCLMVDDPDHPDEVIGDLSRYLVSGGAIVERATNLAAVKALLPTLPGGQWILIIDAPEAVPPLDELSAVASISLAHEARFIVIIRRGRRQRPRVENNDLLVVDGNILTRHEFLKAVAIAAGRVQVEIEAPHQGKKEHDFSPPSREYARQHGRLILVAEDNETNQKVILRQLALFGFAADVANNGEEALERWQSGDYALLLSDLNMPIMDGYELTAAIRAAEKGSSRHTPIVALTANALKSEAEHCSAIGMDDYLSKSAQLADLQAMLEKWLPVASETASSELPPAQDGLSDQQNPADASSLPVDVNVLKALIGDDEATLREFLHDFRLSAEKIAAELNTACTVGQAETAGALAHKLKSSARSVGALALGELCAEMEQAGSAGNTEALLALLPKFEQEKESVEDYLDGY